MIITLKQTTSSEVASKINELREKQGAAALGRVLTLIVVVPDLIDVDRAIEISDAASREHPCRVIVVVDSAAERAGSESAYVNAQIRVGDTAGVSEVVVLEPHGASGDDLDTLVLPLLLSDTPVVTYWPDVPPSNPGAHPLGRLAVRRITDSRSVDCPVNTLRELAQVYTPGDTDLSWSGVTLWRALLAAVAHEFTAVPQHVEVRGHDTHPSSFLIGAWLRAELGVPVTWAADGETNTVSMVKFVFDDGSEVSLGRSGDSSVATLHRSGFEMSSVNLPRRSV